MIYFIQADGVGHIKIGFTDNDDALVRLAQLQTGSPVPLKLLATIPGDMLLETDLKRRFAAHCVTGEWFKPVPDLVAIIPVNGSPACNGVEVVEKSVSIKVLTVGRKQFSKSLLYQIPDKLPFDAERFYELSNEIYLDEIPLNLLVYPGVWGWIKDEKYSYLIFEHQGKLNKWHVSDRSFPWSSYSQGHGRWEIEQPDKCTYSPQDLQAFAGLFVDYVLKLEQLFIGV